MKYRFSIRRLLIITTMVALILAFCDYLGIFEGVNPFVAAVGLYFLISVGWAVPFLLPGYYRDWKNYRTKRNELNATRLKLEKEAQQILEMKSKSSRESETS